MVLLKCKAGQLLAEIDGGYWIFTPYHGRLFYGCDREKAVAAWRWHVNNAMDNDNNNPKGE